MANDLSGLTAGVHESTQSEKKDAQVWVVSSGKGGVGKTFISASLGLTLSKLGHSVVVADLDLTGANLHTALGLEPSKLSIRNYFENSKLLQETVVQTPYPHLSYIQGFWDSWLPTDFTGDHTKKLVSDLKKINADYVIIDISPGNLNSHLEILKAADERILVTSPEPTSIEKNYRFIETFLCYALKENSNAQTYSNLIKTLRDHRQKVLEGPFSFKTFLKENTGIQSTFFDALIAKPLRLIINSSRSQTNMDLGYSIKSVCYKYYDLGIDYMGAIDYDNAVWQSVRNREPVLVAQPFTPLAGQFLTICKHLIDPSELRAVI
jgi:flagellar biosynthesis protein FlhG